jgi:serine/threonine protein kinase
MVENFVGKQIGPYQIDSFIGRGGMALVYKAFHPGMNRFVAIKLLPYDLHNDQMYADLFKKEAQLITELQHPHILPVYGYGETEAYVYILMQLIERGTLFELMRGVSLTLGRIYDIISQVGSALAYAHSRGIVHRDVKPQNILIDERGSCWLTDFGISKILAVSSGLTSKGIIGTPDYMSPEQAIGKRVDARSDIYSFGVVLYEMVAGRLPFRAETPIATIIQHVHAEPPLPRTFDQKIPMSVEQVILKALAKDPADRFHEVTDMIHVLGDSLSEADKALEFGPIPFTAASPGFLSSFTPPAVMSAATRPVPHVIAPKAFASPEAVVPSYSGSVAVIGSVEERMPSEDEPDLLSRLIARAKLGPWGYLDGGKAAIRALRAQEEEASRQRLTKMWAEERKRQRLLMAKAQKAENQARILILGMAVLIMMVVARIIAER